MTDAAGHAYALRRPPVSHVLATAHDMAREHTVISALQATDVPVPRTLGLCTDTGVNGAPFYVMSFVEGHILRDERPRPRCPRRCGPTPRTRWSTPWPGSTPSTSTPSASATSPAGRATSPASSSGGTASSSSRPWTATRARRSIDRAWEELSAKIPEQQGVAIVHGDYRLDNTVLDDRGDVIAILDWEICTLGDPLADLGLLLVYWAEADDADQAVLGVAPTALPGFATRAQLVERYAAASGRDVSAVPYYRAFGIWKLACILQGVYVRYAGGAAAGDRSGVDQFADGVARLGERALADVEAL